MYARSLQGFGYGDVVHQFEKRCNISKEFFLLRGKEGKRGRKNKGKQGEREKSQKVIPPSQTTRKPEVL
ncbi:MAG: hypothetical protein MGU50_10040 [Trichodesmium sp. MAG_R02]|nr:hypothetical protein [Trichodesmium sp. MAG_R02]